MTSVEEHEASTGGLSKSGTEGSQNLESPNAIDVAYLYRSTDVLAGWTSSLPWKADELIDLKQCPISGDSVVMICDGMAMAAVSEEDPATESIIRFKYGKKTYQLSTATKARISTTKPREEKSSISLFFGSLFGMATSQVPSSVNNAIVPTEIFAQDRIAEALDLVSLKILHKGSLLFDSQLIETSKPSREELTLVSRAVLKISDDDWKTENRKKKATLVVMGTRKKHRLNELSVVDSDGPATGGFQILKRSILVPFHIIYWPCKMAWYFVVSFLEPFLPSHRMLGNSDDSRPHQD